MPTNEPESPPPGERGPDDPASSPDEEWPPRPAARTGRGLDPNPSWRPPRTSAYGAPDLSRLGRGVPELRPPDAARDETPPAPDHPTPEPPAGPLPSAAPPDPTPPGTPYPSPPPGPTAPGASYPSAPAAPARPGASYPSAPAAPAYPPPPGADPAAPGSHPVAPLDPTTPDVTYPAPPPDPPWPGSLGSAPDATYPGAPPDSPWSSTPGPAPDATYPGAPDPSWPGTPGPPPPPPASGGFPAPVAPTRRRRTGLIVASLVVIAALAAGLVVVLVNRGGDEGGYEFGAVDLGDATATVITETEGEPRQLDDGETIEADWILEVGQGVPVTLELVGGGLLRFDAGARVTFADLAAAEGEGEGEDGGGDGGPPEPAVEVDTGRIWYNPGGPDAADPVQVTFPGGSVTSEANPVGLECADVCDVAAPAGGVSLATEAGDELEPGPDEVVVVPASAEGDLDLRTDDEPSDWVRDNVDADAEAGLPESEPVETPGVLGLAVLEGGYFVDTTVTSAPSGDPIPTELQWPEGENQGFSGTIADDGCTVPPCDFTIELSDGTSGTGRIDNGSATLSMSEPTDCYDETFTDVIIPGIGTQAFEGTLEVTDARRSGDHWVATSLEGTGTFTSTLTTPCNPGETLGTSTSEATVSATGGT